MSSRSKPTEKIVVRNYSRIQSEAIRWLWDSRIPMGKLTIIAGEPGVGKSFLTLDIAARVSNGEDFPDGRMGAFIKDEYAIAKNKVSCSTLERSKTVCFDCTHTCTCTSMYIHPS